MTKKLKILLIAVLGLVAAVCISVFAGCKFNYSVDEYKEMYGLSARVTYFLNLFNGNGGKFNDSKYYKDMYYREGEIALDLGSVPVSSGSSGLSVDAGFNFDGWYIVEVDGNGNPKYADGTVYTEGEDYDANKGMVLGEKFDFTKPLEKDAHIYLCGVFYEDVKLKFSFFCGEGDFDVKYTTTDADGKQVTATYEKGEIIEGVNYIIPNKATGLADVTGILSIPGYTVMGLYASPDDDEVFGGWPILYPEPNEEGNYEDIILYAKLLEGTYKLVSTANDVKNMFSVALKTNYYITQDIDCGGIEVTTRNSFSGIIYGGSNGCTISNFVAKKSGGATLTGSDTASLFGTLKSGAEFKNITFDDFTVEFSVMINQDAKQINLFAEEIEEGVLFENFAIKNCELNVTYTNNMFTSIDSDSWIFGTAVIPEGVTVENAACFVNGKDYFEETTNSDIINTEVQ